MELNKQIKRTSSGWSKMPHKFIDLYAPVIGHMAVAVYVAIKRHVNKERLAWPSNELIASELRMSRRSVIRSIKKLKECDLVIVIKKKYKTRWSHNEYYLTKVCEWRKLPYAPQSHGKRLNNDPPGDLKDTNHVSDSHTKKNHIKNNSDIVEDKDTNKIKTIRESIKKDLEKLALKKLIKNI